MRLHLDTSFLIDWRRRDPRVAVLSTEISSLQHEVSVDPIVETEFFATSIVPISAHMLFSTVLSIGTRVDITPEIAQLAARWLAPMDEAKRRAHFADAIIAACATETGATLVTGDARLPRVFPTARVSVY